MARDLRSAFNTFDHGEADERTAPKLKNGWISKRYQRLRVLDGEALRSLAAAGA